MLNNIHQKIFWSDAILQALDLNQQSYTYSNIQDALKKKFNVKNSHYVCISDNNIKNLLNLSKSNNTYRISYLMNHFMRYFTISNDKPTSKYYSIDSDFVRLDNKSISNIISIL